ncbi:MAG: DUF1292 domain-containing protein [Clostridia bacterium]|nr:DUF1292 domain-containing protein [Clostridia bacterium]
MENTEADLVYFKDEGGNEIVMEVLDYFFYEGEEYATLIDYDPENDFSEAQLKGVKPVDITVMKIVPVGEDEEEFVPIEDDLARRLTEMLNSGMFDETDSEEDE